MLVVKNETVSDGGKIAPIVSKYFSDITKRLNLRADEINHQEKLGNIWDTFTHDDSMQRITLANFLSKKVN